MRSTTSVQERAVAALRALLEERSVTEVDAREVETFANEGRRWESIRVTTWLALERRGLVRIRRVPGVHQRLCLGAFGRWSGGTELLEYVDLYLSLPAVDKGDNDAG